jgi:hypothetical protein
MIWQKRFCLARLKRFAKLASYSVLFLACPEEAGKEEGKEDKEQPIIKSRDH